MRAYIVRRLFLMVPTFLLVTVTVFCLARFVPGSVIDQMMAGMGSAAGADITRAELEKDLGLDQPIHVQYGRWLGGLIRGDLGTSLWERTPVVEEIANRLPVSIELGVLALVVGLLIAFPVGIYSGIRQDTAGDYVGRTIAILFISLPSFWVGTLIVVYPSIWFGWSPEIRYIPFLDDPLRNLGQFIIPAVIMGMVMSGTTMRMTRTMMLEVLRQDYIRTAWSKGLRERVVVMRHALKNALIPVITITGMQLPVLIGGSVIMEQIFVLPGIGLLMVEALNKRNYPIISGINVMMATAILLINLLVDLTYAYLDPRVQYR